MYYQTLIQGLVVGAIYALSALGVNIIFGIMKIVNWANSSLLMVSMYLVYWGVAYLGMNPYLAILVAAPAMYLFGWVFQHFVIRPLYIRDANKNPYGLLLCTAGLGIVLENLFLMIFGTQQNSVEMSISKTYVDIGFGGSVSLVRLIGAGIAVVTVILVWLFMSKTYAGRALRATAQDRNAAQLMGIDVLSYYDIAFGLGCGLCAIAGCVNATFYTVQPSSGKTVGSMAFIILVLGGIESVPGVLWAGLIIGVIENIGAMFFNQYVGKMLCYLVFVLVLFFRPNGLFGKKAR